MSDMNYSLCAAYPLRSKPDKLMLFRLADYNVYSREFMQIARSDWAAEIEPKIIGAKPADVFPNLTEVRRWEYDEDDDRGHTFSFREDAIFFEIVFPKELQGVNYNETKKIREVLLTGVSLPASVSSDLMIVIGETNSRYAAICCAKNKLKLCADGRFCISDNITDVLHATHFLSEHDILKNDIIDTAGIGITLADGSAAPTRYFYRFSELPQSNGRFYLFRLDSYIPQFIARYLRKNKELAGIGNADIRKIIDTIETILSNREYISEYFATTGYTMDQLCEQLPEYSATIVADMLLDQELDDAVRATLFSSEEIKRHCIDAARDEWVKERDEEKETILSELAELESKSEQLKRDNEVALEQVEARKELSKELSETISLKNTERDQIQHDIDEELRLFSDSLVHNVAIASVVRATTANATACDGPPNAIRFNSFEVIGAEGEIENRVDFEDCISDNLETLGYSAEDAVDISQLITFCICNRQPLVVANDGESITNAVSAVYGLSQSGIIHLPSGFSDTVRLQTQIENAIANRTMAAVYITGVFDGYSAGTFNAIKQLLKDSSVPVFIAIALDGASPEVLPHTIWESAMYLDDDSVFQYAVSEPLSMYESVPEMTGNYSEKEVKEKLKQLKIFDGIIDRRANVQLAKLMIDFDFSSLDNAIILQQLFVFASAKDNADKFFDILKELSVSDKAKRLIQRYM